jgi:hypothetical protein
MLLVKRDSNSYSIVSARNQEIVDANVRVGSERIPEQIEHAMSSWFITVVSQLEAHRSGWDGVEFGYNFNVDEIIRWAESTANIMSTQKADFPARLQKTRRRRLHLDHSRG